MIRILQFLFGIFILSSNVQLLTATSLVGFWYNWNDSNAPYIHLDSINDNYDYIEISFAVPTSANDMTMLFTPDIITQNEFISKVQYLKNKGKKVLISIGGATSVIDLTTQSNKDAFVTSMTNLINTYGFDGLDIDIEHGNSILITGGTIANPTNTAQINLIDAIRIIMSNYRTSYSKKMLLTISPETAYVQGGQSGFGSIWGGYLPIIHALRDSLDIVQVQLYNSGTMYGLDGNIYSQGTADFIVAMTEAVVRGFNTNGGFFLGIPANKVAVGLPASLDAAGGGFTDTANALAAMNYLLGKGPRPGSYSLIQQGAYPNLRGMMTWSINWDAKARNGEKYQFARNYHRIFYGELPSKVNLVSPADNSLLFGNIEFRWMKNLSNTTAYQINIYSGANLIISDSTLIDSTKSVNSLTPGNTYSWKVRAKNALGWGEWSDLKIFSILDLPAQTTIVYPSHNELIKTNNITISWNITNQQVSNYHLLIVSEDVILLSDSSITDTSFSFGLSANKSYEIRVRAKNPSGWGNWSNTTLFSTISLPSEAVLLHPSNNIFFDKNFTIFVWNKVLPDIDYYQIEIYRSSNLEKTDSMITDTIFYLSDLVHKNEYSWRIRAKNSFGWGNWTEKRVFTYLILPSVADLLKPFNNSILNINNIEFVWNSVNNMPKWYHIEISNKMNNVILDSIISDTTFNFSSFEFGEEYSWRVRAENSTGWGEWSDTWVFSLVSAQIDFPMKVLLSTPTNSITIADTIVSFKWFHSSPDVERYELEINQNDYILFADSTISDTTFNFSLFEFGEEYSWRVRAKNSTGWGEWSDTWVFEIDQTTTINDPIIIGYLISPNPASEYIEINLKSINPRVNPCVDAEGDAIKIYNTFGECVMVEQTSMSVQNGQTGTSDLLRIDISHLPFGLFFIQIGNYSEKFVVVR